MSRLRVLWYVAIALAIMSSAVIAVQRSGDDSRYLSVEICAEFESAAAHSERLGYESIESYLFALRESGVVSVAIGETSLSDIVSERGSTVFTGFELQDRDVLTPILLPPIRALIDSGEIRSESLYVVPGDGELVSLLGLWFSSSSLRPITVELHAEAGQSVVAIAGDPSDISECRFGLRASQVRLALDAGLRVVPRLTNSRSASLEAVDSGLMPLASIRELSPVIFSGTEVLGHPDCLAHTSARMREIDVVPAIIEFHVQQGDRALASLLDYEIVRVHSITPGEYRGLSGQDMLDRLLRAVSERNVRLLYLRPHLIESQLAEGTALDFISSLRYRLENAGFVTGPARAYPNPHPGLLKILLPAMTAGVVALGLLVVDYVYPMRPVAQVITTALAAVIVAIVALADPLLARLLLALSAAVAVPAVAVLAAVSRVGDLSEEGRVHPAVSSLRGWMTAYLIAVAGGLVVAGVLSDRSFFVKVTQFLGVKVSHTVPFAVGGGLLWWYRYGKEYVAGHIQVSRDVKQVFLSPLRLWHVAAAVVILGGFTVYLARTGNTFFIDVPVLDQRLRETFEAFLPVRPRTKEVFVGHPALVASLYAYARSRGRCSYALFGVLVGMVGLISVVNTFAHLHTPIVLTLLRVLLGAVVSLPVSLVAVICVSRLMPKGLCEPEHGETAAANATRDSEVGG